MEKLTLKVKRLSEDAKLPVQATPDAGCWDVFASSDSITTDKYIEYKTDLAFELPEGYDMLIFPRSSVSNTDLILANGVGFLDNGYRGELKFRFKFISEDDFLDVYTKGDRIGQIKLIAKTDMVIEEVSELSSTQRGEGGWGSTGR